jgi:four helix bundle protein
MTEAEMKQRTKVFALRVIKLADVLSKQFVTRRLADQLLRCGTSVAANYRSACRARSRADFINKLGIVEEEPDESAFWIELLAEGRLVPRHRLEKLLEEANQLTAIMVASRKSLNDQKSKFKNQKLRSPHGNLRSSDLPDGLPAV